MTEELSQFIYLILYLLATSYFIVLGCIMLTQRENIISTHGELMAKRRMTQSVAIFMFTWAFDCMIYLFPMFYCSDFTDKGYEICYLITLMLDAPLIYMVMHAVVQKKENTPYRTSALGLPFLCIVIWYIIAPEEVCGKLPIHIASLLNIACILFLIIRHAREYRIYVSRIKSEYSDISGREIFWSWSCFAGFAVQAIIFIIYQYCWEPWLDIIYGVLSFGNATYLCHCTCRQRPLDNDVVEEEPTEDIAAKEDIREKAFYSVIEQKLESLCEAKLLFLEPDLTRETLCLRLSISSTYLKMYFHSRGLSFYQYINTLRIEHAVKLMQENPDMQIREISELSGFRSQTTFRKMFKEVMGCLPSEIRKEPMQETATEPQIDY